MKWTGHVARMVQKKNSYIILFSEPNGMRLLARIDGKIILDRISEKQGMAVRTALIQRGSGTSRELM